MRLACGAIGAAVENAMSSCRHQLILALLKQRSQVSRRKQLEAGRRTGGELRGGTHDDDSMRVSVAKHRLQVCRVPLANLRVWFGILADSHMVDGHACTMPSGLLH